MTHGHVTPDLWLPSQLQTITVPLLVPNTAWWTRLVCVKWLIWGPIWQRQCSG